FVLRVRRWYTDSAFAPVESKPGMALPAHRARLVGSPGLRDPEGEAELAERHDAGLKAWIASGSAGGERMIELVESASHWSQAPLSPEYRRAIELLEDHWENDLDNRIDEATDPPPEVGTPARIRASERSVLTGMTSATTTRGIALRIPTTA